MVYAPDPIDAGRLASFRTSFQGEVVVPNDATYDDARRVWNGMIDRRPSLIVRPTSSSDVTAAIRFGRDEELLIAVRGGGHSMPGYGTCDGGLAIDLSAMRGVTVDPERRTARANGGALLGELDTAAQTHGLVCPVGVVSHTGVGGLTLGGGMGRLQRKHGFTIDNLRSVDLVTADGRLVHASDDENPGLFWAIRGAGANFGVVTSFEFQLHPFGGKISIAKAFSPASSVRDAWALFDHLVQTMPDHVMLAFGLSLGGAGAAVADEPVGKPIVTVAAYHSGDPATAESELKPVTDFRPSALATATFEAKSYLDLQRIFDDDRDWGHRVYTKGGYTDGLPEVALDSLAAHFATATPTDSFGMWAQGGAIARVAEDAMAFTGRAARFQMSAESAWDDSNLDASHIGWARAAYAILEPYSKTGRYVNDVSDSVLDLGRWIYGDAIRPDW